MTGLNDATIDKLTDELAQLVRTYWRLENVTAQERARGQITGFARALAAIDRQAMMNVYDTTVEKYGDEAVRGVSAAWTGIDGWQA